MTIAPASTGHGMRLGILASHPVQYYAPLFRRLAQMVDVHVFYAYRASPQDQARAGFGTAFDWDVDLTSGYTHEFLHNVSRSPGTDHFKGCDTPDVGVVLKQRRCDALLVTGWHLKSYLQGVWAAKRSGLPVLVRGDSQLGTPRSALRQYGKRLLYPFFLRRFDAALYVGERSRAYYSYYGVPEERLFFSPHSVDTAWFKARAQPPAREEARVRMGLDPKAKVVLFAGRMLPFKRPGDLLDAAALCRRNGLAIEVLIAGDGEMREPLGASAAQQGVPLHLLGFCNQTEMPAAYAAADCLVLTSDARETWGLVANEALACGTPIIVSDACGCHPDLTADPRAGRVFPMGDVAALARAISETFAAPVACDALEAMTQTYNLEASARGIVAALQSVTGGRRA